jgi:hypothetical protein
MGGSKILIFSACCTGTAREGIRFEKTCFLLFGGEAPEKVLNALKSVL